MKIHKQEFESLAALAARARQGDSNGASHGKNGSWSGCSFEKAIELAEHGWPEGAAKAKAMLDKIKLPELIDTHSSTYADVCGSYVDVGEYVQGVPECMREFHEDTRRSRYAEIVVNASYHAGISPESLMQRGIAIAAVVDALESRCIRCSITVHQIVGGYAEGERVEISLELKRAHEPLNLDVVAYVLAHPSYLRRLMFGVAETFPEDVRSNFGFRGGGSYGYPKNLRKPDEDAIIFDQMSSNWTHEQCLQAVRESLSKFDPDLVIE